MISVGRVVGIAAAVAVTFGISGLSRMPVASSTSDQALLRLAWRARPERIERCVTQSPDALAALPPHMRQATRCEGVSATYRLEVRHNDRIVAERLVEPGGLRRDRPLYVFLEIPVPAGEANLGIGFVRVGGSVGNASDDEGESRDALREAVPASLRWDKRLHFAPGQVRVISYDPERRQLIEVRSASSARQPRARSSPFPLPPADAGQPRPHR